MKSKFYRSAGTITDSYHYDAFGNGDAASRPTSRMSGKRSVSAWKLICIGSGSLDLQLGRFLETMKIVTALSSNSKGSLSVDDAHIDGISGGPIGVEYAIGYRGNAAGTAADGNRCEAKTRQCPSVHRIAD